MVSGLEAAETKVPLEVQCADIHRIALGRGMECAMLSQFAANSLFSTAFIGDPWPTNKEGMSW
jgi:hypothetical protein